VCERERQRQRVRQRVCERERERGARTAIISFAFAPHLKRMDTTTSCPLREARWRGVYPLFYETERRKREKERAYPISCIDLRPPLQEKEDEGGMSIVASCAENSFTILWAMRRPEKIRAEYINSVNVRSPIQMIFQVSSLCRVKERHGSCAGGVLCVCLFWV
jgi:hypothetical protein